MQGLNCCIVVVFWKKKATLVKIFCRLQRETSSGYAIYIFNFLWQYWWTTGVWQVAFYMRTDHKRRYNFLWTEINNHKHGGGIKRWVCIWQISFRLIGICRLTIGNNRNKLILITYLDASGSRSEIPGKFWNVVLEKDGEDQLDRSCEKWRSVT